MLKKLLLFAFLLITVTDVWAQEMYLSISGQNSALVSGDNRHQYDIWLKPESGGTTSNVQIFDAGYGGAVDFVTGDGVTTTTTYYLYRFDDMFTFDGTTVIPKGSSPEPIAVLDAQGEERFKTRWVSLNETPLNPGGNGYIIRVVADEGDDVNGYNVRVTDTSGSILTGNSWQVIAIDLSVALYRSTPQKYYQIRPFNEDLSIETTLTVAGEEDSKVSKIDAFGTQYEVNEQLENLDTRLGLENNWGLNLTGSSDWLNNVTVYGTEEPVLWLFEPIVIDLLVKPEVIINQLPTRKCTELVFELNSNSIQLSSLRLARWLSGEEVLGEGVNPTIEFNQRGDNTLRLLIPNNTSYFPSYWVYNESIFVNTPPVAKLDIPKAIISPGEEITLSAEESYDFEGKPLTYTWLVNGIRRGDTGSTFNFQNTISGTYTISVQVSDGGTAPSCSNAQQISELRVNTQPYAEISFPEIIGENEDVAVSAVNAIDADNDSLSFLWFGDSVKDSTTGRSVTINQDGVGEFDITLVIDDNTGSNNSQYTTSFSYEVNAPPVAAFDLPQKAAPGDIVTFNASNSTDSNGDAIYYSWFVDDQVVADSVISEFIFSTPGDYKVTLTADDGQGVSNSITQLDRMIHINASPVPVIDALDLSPVSNIDFSGRNSTDAESNIAMYMWDFGDGNGGNGPQVSHTYQSSGTYVVKLTVDDGEGLSNSVRTIEKTVSVNSHPIASFDVPEVVAPGEPFVADASTSSDAEGEIASYEWFLDDQPAGNDVTLSLSIEDQGTHTVTLRVRDDSGFEDAQGVLTKAVRVNLPPVANWSTNPATIEPGKPISFIASNSYDPDGQIVSYQWIFSDSTVVDGPIVEKVFEDGGPKRFELRVTDNSNVANSVTTVQGELAVNHEPYIVTESFIRSNNLRVRLDASESYDLNNDPISFEWTLPDGTKRNDSNFSWTAPNPGIHIVSLTIDDGLGLTNSKNSETIQIQVNSPVKAVVDPVISSCTGQTVLFNSSQSFDPDGDPFTVKWTFGDGTTSMEPNPSYRYETAGQYTATLELHDGFSEDTTFTQIPVIIEGSPIARVKASETTICVNSRIVFDGRESSDPSGNLPSLTWDLGDGNTKTGGLIDHVFTRTGEYNVTLTVEGSGSGNCSNISQISTIVNVVAGPVADFTLPDWVIPNEDVALDGSASAADGGFKTATWTIVKDSTEVQLDGITQNYQFPEAGEYTVTLDLLTNTETTCNRVSLTRKIKVNAKPVIALNVPETNLLGEDIILNGDQSYDPDGYIAQYNWYFDDELISTNANEVFKLATAGFHTVRLVITDNSAASNNTVIKEEQIFVNSPPEPIIVGPSSLFQNESVTLSTKSVVDADGDVLKTQWFVDGMQVTVPQITADENRSYRVVLIQDDGRGLGNSVDSAVVQFSPRTSPEITPVYPDRIVVGGRLELSNLNVGADIGFINGALFDNYWVANQLGTTTFTLGWKPDNSILYRQDFVVYVEEVLRFTEDIQPVTVTWDAANPKALLTAPDVNRENSDVLYTWKRNGRIIGYGKRIEVSVEQGLNTFSIEVNDQKVAYSNPISSPISVNAQ